MDADYGRELDGVLDSAAWAEVGMGTGSGKGSRADQADSAEAITDTDGSVHASCDADRRFQAQTVNRAISF